jgi:hypothetical protein
MVSDIFVWTSRSCFDMATEVAAQPVSKLAEAMAAIAATLEMMRA